MMTRANENACLNGKGNKKTARHNVVHCLHAHRLLVQMESIARVHT